MKLSSEDKTYEIDANNKALNGDKVYVTYGFLRMLFLNTRNFFIRKYYENTGKNKKNHLR